MLKHRENIGALKFSSTTSTSSGMGPKSGGSGAYSKKQKVGVLEPESIQKSFGIKKSSATGLL